jgi:hypothetical protein
MLSIESSLFPEVLPTICFVHVLFSPFSHLFLQGRKINTNSYDPSREYQRFLFNPLSNDLFIYSRLSSLRRVFVYYENIGRPTNGIHSIVDA